MSEDPPWPGKNEAKQVNLPFLSPLRSLLLPGAARGFVLVETQRGLRSQAELLV